MSKMKCILVYVTTPDEVSARTIGTECVNHRLAACANIGGPMCSIYNWQGKLEESTEWVLLLKTREERFPLLKKLIRTLHSYENPCIVSLAIQDGSPEFLKWIKDQTKIPPGPTGGRPSSASDRRRSSQLK